MTTHYCEGEGRRKRERKRSEDLPGPVWWMLRKERGRERKEGGLYSLEGVRVDAVTASNGADIEGETGTEGGRV